MNERRCAHTWIVEPPNGPFSLGRCDSCGGTRGFPNALVEPDFVSGARRRPFRNGQCWLRTSAIRNRGSSRF